MHLDDDFLLMYRNHGKRKVFRSFGFFLAAIVIGIVLLIYPFLPLFSDQVGNWGLFIFGATLILLAMAYYFGYLIKARINYLRYIEDKASREEIKPA